MLSVYHCGLAQVELIDEMKAPVTFFNDDVCEVQSSGLGGGLRRCTTSHVELPYCIA